MTRTRWLGLAGLAIALGCSSQPLNSAAPAPVTPSQAPALPPGTPVVDVKKFGAKGDGVTDDRAAVSAALGSAAKAGGGIVFFPPGVYIVGRDGVRPYSIDVPCSNCTLLGVRGASWLRHPAHLPATPVALLRINDRSNVTIRDLGLDGNWGNKIGGVDSQDGINHGTQRDPKNHLIMLRGAKDVTIEHVALQQAYGDCIWMGFADKDATKWTQDVRIIDSTCDMAARDGIAVGQAATGIYVDRCRFTNIFTQAFDTEPVNQPVQDVSIENSFLGGWWNPANPGRAGNIPLSIIGGSPNAGQSLYARHYRVRNNQIQGGVLIASAADVVLEGNRIVLDWDGHGYPPVMVRQLAENITIANNYIYTRTTHGAGDRGAAIAISFYAAGATTWAPSSVRVVGNQIHAHHGNSGIRVNGAGGPQAPSQAGTAATITATELTDPSAAWRPNAWRGATVKSGPAIAIVRGNTRTTLNLAPVGFGTKTGWMTALGTASKTPAPGSYTVGWSGGVIDVANNTIDLSDDGDGPGKHGIVALSERAGTRVRIHGNTIRNAVGEAIYVQSADRIRPFTVLELFDNTAVDDQPVTTTTATIGFSKPQFIRQLVMRGNVAGDGVPAAFTGISSGTWMIEDGAAPRYAGYGSPEGVIAAPVGAAYQRVDSGSAGDALYVKRSGAGNTGWAPAAPGGSVDVPAWVDAMHLAGAAWDPALGVPGSVAIAPGRVVLVKIHAYRGTIAKVLFEIGSPLPSGAKLHVGLYRADGTQTPEMAAANTDATAAASTAGAKSVTLGRSVTVSAGEDIYAALLVTGRAGRPLALRGSAPSATFSRLDATAAAPRSASCCHGVRTLPRAAPPAERLPTMPWIGLQ